MASVSPVDAFVRFAAVSRSCPGKDPEHDAHSAVADR